MIEEQIQMLGYQKLLDLKKILMLMENEKQKNEIEYLKDIMKN
jgi:hypothetical protein